jgi:predicted transcriptional regulator
LACAEGDGVVLRVKALGDLEAEVMDRMWALAQPLTVREVLADLSSSRDLAYTTVMTVMDNLFRKQWLVREMVNRAWVYSPSTSREQYSATLMESALTASNDSNATLVHFVSAMGPDELAVLQAAMKAAQAATAAGPPAPAAGDPSKKSSPRKARP